MEAKKRNLMDTYYPPDAFCRTSISGIIIAVSDLIQRFNRVVKNVFEWEKTQKHIEYCSKIRRK